MAVGGYAGKMLRVDLSSGTFSDVTFPEETLRKYIGGTGIGVRILYDEVPPSLSWDHPDNRFILATGPLGGTRVKGSGTISIVTKGAMTNGCTSTQGNGFLGAYLKFCGYDGLIIQGQAPHLMYLAITDKGPELRDARHLAGKDTWEQEDLIKAELGFTEHQMSVHGIGPAGENLVRFAGVIGDRGHAAAHNGSGAVLGAKRLKAIAVARGKKRLAVRDAPHLVQASDEMFETIKNHPMWSRVYNYGMLWGLTEGKATKTQVVKNYTTNIVTTDDEKIKKFEGPYIREHYQPKPHNCWACQMHHCHLITITEGPYKGFVGEEPEAEGLSAFGPLIGNEDGAGMIVLNNEVDRLGMDINEAGWIIAGTMEMYERGLLTLEDTDGLELRWGNVEAVRGLIRKIAHRQGIGNILAEGAKRASEKLGKEAREIFIYTMKGNSPRTHDHRVRWIEMMESCISNTGTLEADVMSNPAQLGVEPIKDAFNGEQVSTVLAKIRGGFTVVDSLGICKFTNREVPALIVRMLNAGTGWDFTWDEAMQMGRRVVNLMRAYNIQCGLGPAVEGPGPRYGSTPTDGAAQGKSIRPVWPDMVRNFHQLMGWDPATGKPTKETLTKLGLEEVIPTLWG
ncbi:MAG: hypothetical protein HYY01_03200 [Chloroflexi bacterium]|nr:hypothetical protein [Chloroflexota bacterium]